MPRESTAFKTYKGALKLVKRIVSRVPHNQNTTVGHELKVRSLLLLSHAVIEEYLEELSREIASSAVSKFKSDGHVTIALLALIGSQKSGFAKFSQYPLALPSKRDALEGMAREALEKQIEVLDKNHGIRAKSLHELLWPIGIDIERFDAQLYGALDAYGRRRGAVAHKIGAQISDTRSSLFSELTSISTLLKRLDEEACECPRIVMFSL